MELCLERVDEREQVQRDRSWPEQGVDRDAASRLPGRVIRVPETYGGRFSDGRDYCRRSRGMSIENPRVRFSSVVAQQSMEPRGVYTIGDADAGPAMDEPPLAKERDGPSSHPAGEGTPASYSPAWGRSPAGPPAGAFPRSGPADRFLCNP